MGDGNGGLFRQNDDAYTYPDAEDVGYMSLTSDVEGAIALLEEAGYKFEGGVLSAETPLSFEYLVTPARSTRAWPSSSRKTSPSSASRWTSAPWSGTCSPAR